MVYLYDGTFAGLLTVLARIFAWKETPEEIRAEGEGGLFAEGVEIDADPDRAARFLAAVEARTSRRSARILFCLHASEAPGAEMIAYRYLALGRRLGPVLDGHVAHPDVAAAHRLAQRLLRETHRLKGLVRFRELADGLLYAPLEPDGAVLPFLAPHFARRLPRENWLIHDLHRGMGVFGRAGEWRMAEIDGSAPLVLADEEPLYQELWRRFFAGIAIPERRSARRQRQFMPKKYWRHLVEME